MSWIKYAGKHFSAGSVKSEPKGMVKVVVLTFFTCT
jgi:hypothetical protein